MQDSQEVPQHLPLEQFMEEIAKGDFDLTQLRASLGQFSETTFGKNLAGYLDLVTSNTGAHAVLRSELHSRGQSEEFQHDNLPIRQEVARRIRRDTGYAFNPQISSPQDRERLWEALQAFTGMPVDAQTKEEINLKVPDKFPPSIYKIPWVGEDEIVIRQDDLYSIDRTVKSGHILNANEITYTVFKAGQLKGVMSMAELSDYDRGNGKSTVYTRVSAKPLSQTYFTDKITGSARNEFVYVSPQSSYLQSARPTSG